jgi:thiosulfate sulfurtransferase
MDASITAAALRQALRSGHPPLVIDVRREQAFLAAGDMLRGALRRDPAQVAAWKAALPAGADMVVYCVHGHEVSQGVARALGCRYLEGGIEAWRAAGGELASKLQGTTTKE